MFHYDNKYIAYHTDFKFCARKNKVVYSMF